MDENLNPEELRKKAVKKAMYLLEKQDRTEQQLRNKLKRDGHSEDNIDAAVLYVKSYHYLDDERYAGNYIRYHSSCKSKQQLKISLLQKGVASEIIDAALEEEYAGDEKAQINNWIRKKKFSVSDATIEERQKFIAFLYRKGFRLDDIHSALGNCSFDEE